MSQNGMRNLKKEKVFKAKKKCLKSVAKKNQHTRLVLLVVI